MRSVRSLAAAVAGMTAVLGAAAVLAFHSVRTAGDRSVRNVASPLIGCPADKIEIRDRGASDTAEWYRVAGCDRTATLICDAPDYDCFASP